MKNRLAFSVIEVMLAAALFVIISTGVILALIGGVQANRSGSEQTVATQFAVAGLEAVRSIKNRDFALLTNTSGPGVARDVNGVWVWNASNNIMENYSRAITISSVNRDGSGNIVASGGVVDADTKKVTSTVTWTAGVGRNNSVILSDYLTNWRKSINGNWAVITQEGTLDLTGNSDGWRVDVSGNYAYIIRNATTANFYVVDISNPTLPIILGTLNLAGTPKDVHVLGNYAYVASTDNNSELQIVNVTAPAAPTLAGVYNATGNDDGNSVAVFGTTVLLGRVSTAAQEVMAINVATTASPTLLSGVALSGTANSISVLGNYAYVASSDTAAEISIVNISNLSTLSLTGTVNATGNNAGTAVKSFGTTLLLGRNGGTVQVYSLATPALPSLVGTYAGSGGGNVSDMSLNTDNSTLFLATTSSTAEFQTVNLASLTSPVLLGSVNLTSSLYGVAYTADFDRAILASAENTAELIIMKPN